MAEQTMVERVARAICAADVLAPEPDAPIYIGIKSAKAWEARQPMARAAIEAMREPKRTFTVGAIMVGDDLRGIYRTVADAEKWAPAYSYGRGRAHAATLTLTTCALAEERHEASPPKA